MTIRALLPSDPRWEAYDLALRRLCVALNPALLPFDAPVDPLLARADVAAAWDALPEQRVALSEIWEGEW